MRSVASSRFLAPLLVAGLVAGCGSPTPSTTSASEASASTAPTAAAATSTPTPTPTPPTYADTLRIGVNLGMNRGWQPATELNRVPVLTFGRLVHSGLYRFDGHDEAIPDLADGPCFVPGADGKVIRCRLVETTFHDGTPLTADDVAYSYQVFARPVLTGGLPTEVRVVDPRTVDFVLSAVDPTFLTTVLPLIPIFSRHSIDEAVAAFEAGTKGLTPAGLDTLADEINAEIGADPPVSFELELFRTEQSGPDPGQGLVGYTSDQISDAEHPDAGNNGGFSDPAFDRLIAAANATYDQADRARLLREAQQELAAQLPTIFLWGMTRYDSLRSAVATVDGPLDLTVPNWAWQPERMVVTKGAQ